jgi:hypothetical protein
MNGTRDGENRGGTLATSRLEIRFFGAASKRHSVTQRFLRCYLVFRTLAGDWGIAVEGGRACGFEGENLREADGKRARLSVLLLFGQVRTNVDEIVGDDAEPDPALHAVKSFVAATIQPVSLFENADAAFASRAPFLKLLEPALFLELFPRRALGGVAGNRNAPHSHLLGLGFIRRGEESGICRHYLRRVPKLFDMLFQGGLTTGEDARVSLSDGKDANSPLLRARSRVGGPLFADLVIGDDLFFRFLNFDQLPEFIRLMSFPRNTVPCGPIRAAAPRRPTGRERRPGCRRHPRSWGSDSESREPDPCWRGS